MEEKVNITDQDSYGFEIVSPEFKPEIKVKLALDISAGQKKEVTKILTKIQKEGTENVKLLSEYAELSIKYIILDWNIFDGDIKLPICVDTVDNKLSSRLGKWVTEKAFGFFLGKKPTES